MKLNDDLVSLKLFLNSFENILNPDFLAGLLPRSFLIRLVELEELTGTELTPFSMRNETLLLLGVLSAILADGAIIEVD